MWLRKVTTGLQSASHTQHALYKGGLGVYSQRKILLIWPTEIKFGSNDE